MKNIHVLPTDKPSELYINMQGVLSKSNSLLLRLKSRHIYITSDEEIGTDEYYFHLKNNEYYNSGRIDEIDKDMKFWRKIILTTDQDLIKDGIQAIDDEFLEWFVENPSCEVVEVNFDYKKFRWSSLNKSQCYKIILPKEEPKKIFDLPIATNLGNVLTETMKSVSQHEGGIKQGEINLPSFKEEVIKTEEDAKIFVETMENIPEPNDKLKKAFRDFNKQETLEEDSKFYFENDLEMEQMIKEMALTGKVPKKWSLFISKINNLYKQQERMYSEDEVLDILNEYRKLYGREDAYKSQLSYFIGQFKNK